MTDEKRFLYDLGVIRIPSGDFPWSIFSSGKINCVYTFNIENLKGGNVSINDMRIWINKNVEEAVYLHYSKWAPCYVAFTKPDDAVQFSLKFGNVIEQLK